MPIDIFNDDGSVANYVSLSERLPAFLAAYPPSEGYSVETEMTDLLSHMPGIQQVMIAAINQKEMSEELTDSFKQYSKLVCRAVLKNGDGKVLQTASACMSVELYKDYEKLETAAKQRLVATCGFGGELFDDDESGDMAKQGLTTRRPDAVQQTEANVSQAVVSNPVKGATKDAHTKVEPTVVDEVPKALVNQINNEAAKKDVAVPEYSDLLSAKAALKTLLQMKVAA